MSIKHLRMPGRQCRSHHSQDDGCASRGFTPPCKKRSTSSGMLHMESIKRPILPGRQCRAQHSQDDGCASHAIPSPAMKKRSTSIEMLLYGIRQRPILPGRVQPSTFGTEGLNCCVRNGNRWDPFVIATGNGELFTSPGAFASRLSHCSTFSLPCQAFAFTLALCSAGAFPHPDNCTSNDSFQTVFQLVSSCPSVSRSDQVL